MDNFFSRSEIAEFTSLRRGVSTLHVRLGGSITKADPFDRDVEAAGVVLDRLRQRCATLQAEARTAAGPAAGDVKATAADANGDGLASASTSTPQQSYGSISDDEQVVESAVGSVLGPVIKGLRLVVAELLEIHGRFGELRWRESENRIDTFCLGMGFVVYVLENCPSLSQEELDALKHPPKTVFKCFRTPALKDTTGVAQDPGFGDYPVVENSSYWDGLMHTWYMEAYDRQQGFPDRDARWRRVRRRFARPSRFRTSAGWGGKRFTGRWFFRKAINYFFLGLFWAFNPVRLAFEGAGSSLMTTIQALNAFEILFWFFPNWAMFTYTHPRDFADGDSMLPVRFFLVPLAGLSLGLTVFTLHSLWPIAARGPDDDCPDGWESICEDTPIGGPHPLMVIRPILSLLVFYTIYLMWTQDRRVRWSRPMPESLVASRIPG